MSVINFDSENLKIDWISFNLDRKKWEALFGAIAKNSDKSGLVTLVSATSQRFNYYRYI